VAEDRVRINGIVGVHSEGTYFIEWREHGKRCRVSVARESRNSFTITGIRRGRVPCDCEWL
jgi:hypothetical protein